MAVVIDASTPTAAVSQTAVSSLTTVAFTPPSGAVLLMLAIFDTATSSRTGTPSTVTGSTSTWTTVGNYNNGNGSQGGLVHVSWARVTSSVSTTVRVTWPASNDCALKVWVLTGTPDAGSPIGVSSSVTLTTNPQTVSYTATAAGSQGFLGLEDFSMAGVKTISNSVTEATLSSNSNGLIVRDSSTAASAGQTRSFSVAGPPANSEVAWVEVIPAAGGDQTVTAVGIASAEAVGVPVVSVAGADQTVVPAAIGSAEALGSPAVAVEGGGGGPLTDRTNVPYTNSAGTSSVGHIYAAGLDWTKSVGLLVYADGSGEYGLIHPTDTYLLAGAGGLVAVAKAQNMVLVTPLAPGNGCTDGDGTCWYLDSYDGTSDTAKAKWADDFIKTQVIAQYDLDLDRACIAGYSSGAEFTMGIYGPSYAASWMTDGLLLAISYGSVPWVPATYTTAFKQAVAAVWDIGGADTTGAMADGTAGYNWYTSHGFLTTRLVVVEGEDHNRGGLFGGLVNTYVDQYVLAPDTDQTVAPTGIGSAAAFGTAMVTLNSGAFGVTLFPAGREGFLAGEIDWDTATIKAVLVRDYTVDGAHRVVSDVTGAGGTLVATSAALALKTVFGGVADAADIVFPSVAVGPPITMLLLVQSSAVTGGADVAATAQRLIGYIDSPPLPFVPNGDDVAVTWSNDRSRIFIL